jgi:hypothetical protein
MQLTREQHLLLLDFLQTALQGQRMGGVEEGMGLPAGHEQHGVGAAVPSSASKANQLLQIAQQLRGAAHALPSVQCAPSAELHDSSKQQLLKHHEHAELIACEEGQAPEAVIEQEVQVRCLQDKI